MTLGCGAMASRRLAFLSTRGDGMTLPGKGRPLEGSITGWDTLEKLPVRWAMAGSAR